MKASEFRKLIREEVKKALNEGSLDKQIKQLLYTAFTEAQKQKKFQQIVDMLIDDYGIEFELKPTSTPRDIKSEVDWGDYDAATRGEYNSMKKDIESMLKIKLDN
jgi:hypothetical protein